jgi:putative PIN family toxin of toxin-antitoxin system
MRVVLDSNVLVRVVISPNGPAAALHGLIRPPLHLLITSKELLGDLSDSLRYPRIRKIHALDDVRIDDTVRDFSARSLTVVLPPLAAIARVSRDPDDDAIIATAVHGKAHVLCTCDKDLFDTAVIQYCANFGIEVLTDLELLGRLKQRSPGVP